MDKSKTNLFQQVVKEACRDGIISNEEFEILKKLAELLGIKVQKGNKLAAEVIQHYKAGKLTFTEDDSPETLYRSVLLAFSDDNVIDGREEETLCKIKEWLGLKTTPEPAQSGKIPEEPVESIVCENGDIKPLRCNSCNGQVPLLRKPKVVCPYCGDTKVIPNAYLEALASRTSFAHRKKQAEELFAKLGTPPNKYEQAFAELDEKMLLISFVLSLGAILGIVQMIIFYPLDWFYASFKGLNMMDVISPWTPTMISTFATFCLSVVPFAYLYWARRKVLTLNHLKIALAAKPPEKAGGPTTCRSCGCPFDVPPNTPGITCPYCQTDNLLNVPEDWLKGTRDTSIRVGKKAVMAQNTFKRETSLGWESVLSVFLLFLFIGGLNWYMVSMRQEPFYAKEGTPWLRDYAGEIKNQKGIRQNKRIGKDFPFNKWIEDADDMEEFYVALKPDQKLKLTWDNNASTIKTKGKYELQTIMVMVRSYTGGLNSLVARKNLNRNEPGIYNPKIGGWYKVKLFHSGMIPYKLKVEVVA